MSTSVKAHEPEIRLYAGKAPGSEHWTWEEKRSNTNSIGLETVYNVVNPTITVFPAAAECSTGTALILCPGGGFHFLAIEHEGSTAAEKLAKEGITVFLLKYRLFRVLNDNPFDEMISTRDKKGWDEETYPIMPLAVADAAQAVRYVRGHAGDFGVSPDHIGIMGFSAGGLLAVAAAFDDNPSSRPDFLVALYPDLPKWDLPTARSLPPAFLACATDDELGFSTHVLDLYRMWYKANRPVELHLYAKGGHGFGIGNSRDTTGNWLHQLVQWLKLEAGAI